MSREDRRGNFAASSTCMLALLSAIFVAALLAPLGAAGQLYGSFHEPLIKSALFTGLDEVTIYFAEDIGKAPDSLVSLLLNTSSYELSSPKDGHYNKSKKPVGLKSLGAINDGKAIRLVFPTQLKKAQPYEITVALPLGNESANFTADISDVRMDIDAGAEPDKFRPAMLGASLDCGTLSSLSSMPEAFEAAVEAAAQLRLGVVRYCNHANLSSVKWERNDSSESAPGAYTKANIDRLAFFLKAINATAMMQVNVCDNNALSWADMVKYANAEKEYGFRYWEIGNKPGIGPESWQECLGTSDELSSAKAYAKRFVNYTRLMKAADPAIKTFGLADSSFNKSTLWLSVLLNETEEAGVALDGLSLYLEEKDALQDDGALNTIATHRSQLIKSGLKQAEVAITANKAYENSLLAAEFAGRAAYNGATINVLGSLYSGLGAGLITLNGSDKNSAISGSPTYHVMILYGQWFGDALISDSSKRAVNDSWQNATGSNAIIFASFDSKDNGKLKLIAINAGYKLMNVTIEVRGHDVKAGQYYELRASDKAATINDASLATTIAKASEARRSFSGFLTAIEPKPLAGISKETMMSVLNITLSPFSATALVLDSEPERVRVGPSAPVIKIVANGPEVAIATPLAYVTKNVKSINITKPPYWANAKNFRINESGLIRPVNLTGNMLHWAANRSSPASAATLLFDVPAPKMSIKSTEENSTRYRRTFTITSENKFFDITVFIPVNALYSGWKLYWFDGSEWKDVTELFGLEVSGSAVMFSGFSSFYQQFKVEGSVEMCSDNDGDSYFAIAPNCAKGNDCDDSEKPINPGAAEVCGNSVDEDCSGKDVPCLQFYTATKTPAGEESGADDKGFKEQKPIQVARSSQDKQGVRLVYREEKPLKSQPEVLQPRKPKPEAAIKAQNSPSLTVSAPEEVEAGGIYNASVKVLSPLKGIYTLTLENMNQRVLLEANEEQELRFTLTAPEAKGRYTLTASVDGSSASKDVTLVYKPLFLYVDIAREERGVSANITVKNYEDMFTELKIVKDFKEDAFTERIEGAKLYRGVFRIEKPGQYLIIATAFSNGSATEEDGYSLTVEQEKPGFSPAAVALLTIAVVALSAAFYAILLKYQSRF